MSIDFDSTRWQRVRDSYSAWWAGELKRPLINIVMGGHDPGRPEPKLPSYGFVPFYGPEVSPEEIVDRWDYNLSCCKFLGDAYPHVFPNFGAGVVAALMGAVLDSGVEAGTVWFYPAEDKDIRDIHFEYDPDNIWLRRIKDVLRAAMERWQGNVQASMTDMGGNLDVLSSFRPSEKLLLDLYDHPEEVKRLTWEAHELWWRFFDEFNSVLQPINPGYSAWAGIYSEEPHYMLQCDFCYMIGPDMFDEFVRPELAASCRRMPNGFYHLDGPGQLPHLDSLLSIPELKGVQWVPGSGSPDFKYWPEVYRKIRDAGKLIQLLGDMSTLDVVAEQLGSAEGIEFRAWGASSEEEAMAFLRKYGAE